MTLRARRAAAGLVLFAMAFVAHPALGQGTAVVRGRVVAADTGLPLRRATVALRSVGQKEGGLSADTDAEGAFTFHGVPAGRYRLSATKTRYVDAALGARAPGRPGRAFDLADGQKIDGLTLPMATAGVITGRVVDDAGEPVANAMVMALRQRRGDGGTRLSATAHSRPTDDTGAYRLFGLPPGRYFLSAVPPHAAPHAHDLVDTSGTTLATTYYASTPVASEAQPIDVAAGLEAFADIALAPTRVTSVAGEVVDTAGRPAKVGFVRLIPQGGDDDASGWLHGGMREGAFSISRVPPGDYLLSVQAFFAEDDVLRMMGSGSIEGGAYTVPLTVSGTPIADLRVVVPPFVDVPGRILFDGDPTAEGRPAVTIFAASNTRGGEMGPRTQAGADGRFTLRVRPGSWRVHAVTAGRWMEKRRTFRGRAVPLDALVEVDGEPGARLEILLTSQLTAITGTASDTDGQPLRDYHVIAFPAAGGDIASAGFRLRQERADAQGRFRVEALPPGDYLVAALADHDPQQQPLDDELLDSLRAGATRVRLGEGATEAVSLKVSPAP
jgi:hypothetical protein